MEMWDYIVEFSGGSPQFAAGVILSVSILTSLLLFMVYSRLESDPYNYDTHEEVLMDCVFDKRWKVVVKSTRDEDLVAVTITDLTTNTDHHAHIDIDGVDLVEYPEMGLKYLRREIEAMIAELHNDELWENTK